MRQEIKLSNKVQVINQDLSGQDFVEGYAVIIGVIWRESDGSAYCEVVFNGEDKAVRRWIRPEIL